MQTCVLGFDVGTGGTRSLIMGGGGRVFASAVYRGVKDFVLGCMRTYLIMKEKAARWNSGKEIHAILQEISLGSHGSSETERYSRQDAAGQLARVFDKDGMSKRRSPYGRFEHLAVELLAGPR